ncbi:RNA polymerase sigma factor SigJ [Streptomyces qinzhouensis]|uniref:Sigma-70 family RNA polymerase sigma factor n=1 Tax=Streptomyces qinzhouensis TaxID=2599401 RepID=A0A5B8J0E8_9ACTN|nr:RNA polymerase sigma factor SigJ [Streptomyces qinzhouensis]QDY75175.1 sigma-70 family RNA polymerase sigma factor [Streptomyces qinzhouensis]QDY80623.1 sigma-70 family RNA polymerase sigma factor [Streptomyces qinzhouensis]
MSSRSPQGDDPLAPGLNAIMSERRKLINLSYRLLGSLADAEDVVQETYVRWYAMSPQQQEDIESPGGWLTKVASRICLDMLGSARARRESYVGAWLPEPVPDRTEWMTGRPTGNAVDPAERVTLDESVSMAFLVVLESLTPAERVAFILHDVFRYPFNDIAEIVGRTPAACRQLATSARRRIRDAEAPTRSTDWRADTIRNFKQAWEAQDIGALVALLDPGAVSVADSGGHVESTSFAIEDDTERIAHGLVSLVRRLPGLTILERMVNGQPGLVVQRDGIIVTVMAFELTDDRITHIWAMRNPDKLRLWRVEPQD